ncbi:hypothetical protein CR513_30892, partial [Mucuna pruriens]
MDIDFAIKKDDHRVLLKPTFHMLLINGKGLIVFIIRGSIDQHDKVRDLVHVIDEQFATFDKSLASTIIMQLSSMKLIGIIGVHDHIMYIRDIVTQLNELEVTMSESFLVHYILCILPR